MHSGQLVKEFHLAFGHPVADLPNESTPELRALRVRLIAEELMEFADSLGVFLEINTAVDLCYVMADPEAEVDLIGAADGLGDLDYVVQGANLVFGFPAEAVLAEIHRSNMSKLGPDGKPIYREDMKVLKGPDYSPPNLAPILGLDDSMTWIK